LPRDDEDLENAGIHITGLGDASEMLDEHAKAAYRRRLSELREELKEAKELGNVERAEQAEEEIDALTGNSHAPWGSVALIAGQHQLQREPGRASPSRSRPYLNELLKVKQDLEICCRDASRRGRSAPTNLPPIFRLPGNSHRHL
jgi:hypothetical protein